MPPHILVLHNDPILAPNHPAAASEHEIVEIADIVAQELNQAGYRVFALGLQHDPAPLLDRIRQDRPDAVFNLFEGFSDGRPAEVCPIAVLEWLAIPYTGNGMEALLLSRDKPRAKYLLQGAELPTPRFQVVESNILPEWRLSWPAIVKPANQDASIGIDQQSVVADASALRRQVDRLRYAHGLPILIEEYVPGREFSVAVIAGPELKALPVSEIVFHRQETGRWPIVTYEAKWAEGSLEDEATRPQCPADLDPAWRDELQRLALKACRLFGCRDFTRVDFRVDPAGRPYILEVNPNPGYHPTAGFANALRAAGMTHAQYTEGMVRRALEGSPLS